MHEYLNMQYVKRKNSLCLMHSFFINTCVGLIKNKKHFEQNWENIFFVKGYCLQNDDHNIE